MKKTLSVLLIVAMLCTVLSGFTVTASAAVTQRGEPLTEPWAPESFVESDWTGDTDAFESGRFVVSMRDSKTIWTTRSFDLSAGFKFKGTLNMKNDFNNFYGEWCSVYFASETDIVELRIKNDSIEGSTEKDNTYTACIVHNDDMLATYDLYTLPNGEYEVLYEDGKFSVAFNDVEINWSVGFNTVKEIPLAVNFTNAKVGLKLENNWYPNGREWESISLSPLVANVPSIPGSRGEPLTEPWVPEEFVESDWIGDTDFDYGSFVIVTGNSTKTIWSNKNFDLTNGFVFLGTLSMKNGYRNYYGEWCSVYFGDETNNLELRIKNDRIENEIRDTYTAYLINNGVEVASCPLDTEPNGQYGVIYYDGQVVVLLDEYMLIWDFMDGSQSLAVEIENPVFENAKIGLRLTGNYCPNSRKWEGIYISDICSVAHVYDDDADVDCNICGEIREVTQWGWKLEDSTWYYYEDYIAATGWRFINNYWYFFDDYGAMLTGWQFINYNWYYFADGGNMLTGWQFINYNWYYFADGGNMLNGWQYINGIWYYFAEGGQMMTGWQLVGGTWYYFNDGGAMVTGWQYIGNTWYYFNNGGAMVKGWQNIGGYWYYFHEGGNMATGWLLLNNTWYYLADGGNMVTGWQYISNTWYYFNAGGVWVS